MYSYNIVHIQSCSNPCFIFCSKNESEKPWYRGNESTERNEKAKKAYEALMTVTLRKPTSKEYKNFSMAVKQRAKLKNITFTYGEEEVSILLFIIILFYIRISHRGLNSFIYY